MSLHINPNALAEMYASGEQVGLCTECGHIVQDVEPDAENYRCAVCGQRAVQGIETLILLQT